MGIKKIVPLRRDMNSLISNLKMATRSTNKDFKTSERFGIDPSNEEFGGYIESCFLSDPIYRDNINYVVEEFKKETGRDLYINSAYLGSDVDIDKITIALGINGIDDYYKYKPELRKTRKRK